MKAANILIADNQFLIYESLSGIIRDAEGLNFCALAQNASDLHLYLAENDGTDLIITDCNQIDFNGFEGLSHIRKTYPGIRILILTNLVKAREINELKNIGISNIILKTAGRKEILHAIDCSLQGKKYYSDEILDLLIDSKKERDEVLPPTALTPSEVEITRLIANGLTTKEIAAMKYISFHTVMSHRKNIFRKLNVKNTSELIMYAIRSGMIDNIEYYI